MPSIIEEAIRNEAVKLLKRHEAYAFNLANELRRRAARSGLAQQKVINRPACWAINKGFDPYYVRCHAGAIAKSIEKSLAQNNYQPRAAFEYQVSRDDGSSRSVSVFQIADSAISLLTYKRLMEKNARHLSASAYAYRADLSVHDAILHIASDLKRQRRFFVAEFDFAKFFSSILHSHLMRMLQDQRFYITAREKRIVEAFLATPARSAQTYNSTTATVPVRGIHQGTSISLFLANLAAYPLDRRLERLGVGFARYADDTLIWSDNYADIGRAANALEDAANEMGVAFNFLKSKGISLLSPSGMPAEITAQDSLEFLGFSISQDRLSIKAKGVGRIKKRIAYLIYTNLLQEPKRGHVVADRMIGSIDKDYRVLIYQLRRYLYGSLSEAKLRRFLRRQTPLIRYKGLMSFYPIIDDEKQLATIDGWMLNATMRALKLRSRFFFGIHTGSLPAPHGSSKAQILQLRNPVVSGQLEDLRFPSFLKISKLMRRASATYGAAAIANVKSSGYYST